PTGVSAAAAAAQPGVPTAPKEATQAAAAAQNAAAAAAPKANEANKPVRSVADSSIRVDVDLLDSLMNLVGELVLSRNQLVQRAAASQDQELQRSMHRLSLVASELQEGVMKTRMQPIENVWSKIPRVVRDLANSLGRQIRVEMEGKDTELDKTILEAIKDPLTHLVRNSCDHGIEMPEDRVAKGKPAEGVLLMKAFHEGGQVNIEIIDDGAGINPEKVKDKAVEKGLISREAADRMSDRDAGHLIFKAGFSTAAAVTNVSGRGVGMDVVKTNIEKIGGVIDVTSEFGRGTTTRIKIPLTLAIIPALLVRGKDNMFAIPQVNLLELVRLDREQAAERLETIQGTPVYRLRGALLPLVDLREQLGEEKGDSDTTFIAVLRADQRQFGLVVDDIEDTEEIVVKPLGIQLRGIDLYAGATLMGDGRVALILDTVSLAARAGMVNDGSEAAKRAAEEAAKLVRSDSTSLLVVRLSNGRRVALPLKCVERLEEFPMTRVETVGQNQVVQYRGGHPAAAAPVRRLRLVRRGRGGRRAAGRRVPAPRAAVRLRRRGGARHRRGRPVDSHALGHGRQPRFGRRQRARHRAAEHRQCDRRDDRAGDRRLHGRHRLLRLRLIGVCTMANQYCTFRLGGHLFGVPVETVQEVLREQDLTKVPLASKEVSGLINLRGQIVITVDLRERMGLPRREEGDEMTNVVVRTSGETVTSLLVDRIGDVLEPDLDRFEAPPDTVTGRVRELVTRVCKLDRELMLVLDCDKAVDVDAAA
ncbi:chemotaxis protein CheA, partial [Kineosphaera limosa NBRC 100340]